MSCAACAIGKYQPFTHNTDACFFCADGYYAPEAGMAACQPCPVPICASSVQSCFSTANDKGVSGIPNEASYHAAGKVVCNAGDYSDPCDLHMYCLDNSLTCPDKERSPMNVAGLSQASEVQMTGLSSNVESLTANIPYEYRIGSMCAEKRVEPRFQYLVTRCNDAQADCAATCFTGLLGTSGGLTDSAVSTFIDGISNLGVQVLHLSGITANSKYTTNLGDLGLTGADSLHVHAWLYEPVSTIPGVGESATAHPLCLLRTRFDGTPPTGGEVHCMGCVEYDAVSYAYNKVRSPHELRVIRVSTHRAPPGCIVPPRRSPAVLDASFL